MKDKTTFFSAAFLTLLIALTLAAPLIAFQDPHDLSRVYLSDSEKPPLSRSREGFIMLLGADGMGRDLFSAILYGLRLSVVIAITSCVLSAILGVSLGLASAYLQKSFGVIIMRVVDLHFAVPPLFLAMIVIFSLGKSLESLILSLIVIQWGFYARVIYAKAGIESVKTYVEVARNFGFSRSRIMCRHVFPNCFPLLLTTILMQLSRAVSLEATLSFLSAGLPQTTPSLGGLIANGFEYLLSDKYWISFFPGIALITLIISINLLEDRLSSASQRRS